LILDPSFNSPGVDWPFINAPPAPLFTDKEDKEFRKIMAFLEMPFGSLLSDRVHRKRIKVEQGLPLEPSSTSSASSEVVTRKPSTTVTPVAGTALDTTEEVPPLCCPKFESHSPWRGSSPGSSVELQNE
jgi:hypothetical protein